MTNESRWPPERIRGRPPPRAVFQAVIALDCGLVRLGQVIVCIAFAAVLAACGSSSSTTGSASRGSSGSASTNGETFTRANWATLQQDPDSHKGAHVDIVGQLLSAPQREKDVTYLQIYADPKNSEWTTIVAIKDPDISIPNDSYVHVVGEVYGKFTGKNLLGAEITDPVIVADSVKVVTAVEAATPATRTAAVGETRTQHGVSITIQKVEFAPDETRVFLSVRNDSPRTAHFYDFDAKAVQGTHQFEVASAPLDYPQVASDILAGVVSDGVISFPASDPEQPLKLVLQASSENFLQTFRPYTFTVAP